MYYEIFDLLNQFKKINSRDVVNKIIIDSLFKNRSYIQQSTYDYSNDMKMFTEENSHYMLIQNIIMGIAQSSWNGLNPFLINTSLEYEKSGRLSVVKDELAFENSHLSFHLSPSQDNQFIHYKDTEFYKWELLFLEKISQVCSGSSLTPTPEGFRFYLFRDLEFIYGMFLENKIRNGWIKLLNDLILKQQSIPTTEIYEKYKINFKFSPTNNSTLFEVSSLALNDYLEVFQRNQISSLSTASLSSEVDLILQKDLTAIEKFSQINLLITGKIPLGNFYLNKHMFICKEVYTLEEYLNYYAYTWTKSQNLIFHILNNNTKKNESCNLQELKNLLAKVKYLVIESFADLDQSRYFHAKPLIVRD